MADEPRRSGRATKGQHTKDREATDDAAPKKKGKGRGSKAKQVEEEEEEEEEEEQDEIIRCICGLYEEEEDEPRAMICCDKCEAWQHNQCMGLAEDYQPEVYFCEQCRPEEHKDLLDAIKRGERPWEEVQKKRDAAKALRGKKGKKGGRKSAASVPVETQEPEEPVSKPAAGQKRKAEETPVPEIKNKKVRGTPAAENGTRATSQSRTASTPARQPSRSESSAGLVAGDPKELKNSSRKGAASTLIKIFGEAIKDAIKRGTYKLPAGSNAADLGLQLGLQVEHFLNHVQAQGADEPGDAYKTQLRSISFNIKKNAELALRVITADISPSDLASMDPKEFASEEQQRKDAALVKEMEKQHEIVQEEGPRIRRTHKGDEYVDEAHAVAPESATSRAPARKQSTVDQDVEMKTPDTSSKAKRPLTVSTGAKPRPSDPRRQSSTNFDFDKVWSGAQNSSDADGPRFPELQQRGSPPPQAHGQGTDPDIDNLLKDEDNESEPYSPKEFTNDDGIVWQGLINGGSLGRFRTSARYAAGATPDANTLRMTWDEVIPAEVAIHGRIQPQKADEYLCGLEYSSTSDLIIVTMAEPKDVNNLAGFEKFFTYLKTKQRYGVGVQHRNPAIKDIYLLPMEAGQALPTFMKALETDFPDPVQERMLLVPVVIKNSELPHNLNKDGQPMIMSPSIGGPVAQTPITPQEGQRDMPNQFPVPFQYPPMPQTSTNGGSPQIPGSPSAPYTGTTYPPHHPPQQTATPTPQNIPNNKSEPTPAMASALRILGPQLASAPAIQNLCGQAPSSGDNEMSIVKECIEQNPMAAQDLSLLTILLQARSQSRQVNNQASGESVAVANGGNGEEGPGPAVQESSGSKQAIEQST